MLSNRNPLTDSSIQAGLRAVIHAASAPHAHWCVTLQVNRPTLAITKVDRNTVYHLTAGKVLPQRPIQALSMATCSGSRSRKLPE